MIEIIAEVGSVHDGSFGNAIKLIEASKICGANTVKFQMHISKAETLSNAKSPSYFNSESRYDYFNRTSFTIDQWNKLIKICKKNKINFLCSPFSIEAINILEKLKVKRYKIPSGEITNIPYLKKISKTNKNCILSTGMSNWKEIEKAVKLFNRKKLVLMQCSSIYPCPPKNVGLNIITEFKKKFNLEVGFSDHSEGIAASLAAVTLGATVIEKHLTFSKAMYGSDAKNAMEIKDFIKFTKEIRDLETMINHSVNKNNLKKLNQMRKIFMKSIVAKKNIKSGKIINENDITLKKPGIGLSGLEFEKVIGKKSLKFIKKNTLIRKKYLK